MPRERCGYTFETDRYPDLGSACCWRPVREAADRCVWHADEDGKPVDELAAREPGPGDRLDGAVLRKTTLDDVGWLSNTVLVDADLEDATAERADFRDADLRNANLRNTSLRRSDFRRANLEDAVLRDADLKGADLEDAKVHEADFSLSYIGRRTNFGGTVIYEKELFEADTAADRLDKFDAATWTYRILQFRCRQNALIQRTKEFFIREKDLRRRFDWQQGNYPDAIRAEGSRWLMGYGYSVRGILATSVLVIVLLGLLYPFVGGIREVNGGTTVRYTLDSPLTVPFAEFVTVFSKSLYFSVISFTTLGAGDVLAHGFVARILSGGEALLGFILLAMLISVLTRRQYWL